MPFNPANASPGVYVFEKPSGVHTITGVATSITAFVGLTEKGTPDLATQILSFADYESTFGGIVPYSQVSYAVNQFFLNGGSQAYVIRLLNKATTPDTVTLQSSADGTTATKPVLQIDSIRPGDTSSTMDAFVVTGTSSNTFTLIVVSTPKPVGNEAVTSDAEVFDNLSMDNQDTTNYVVKRVNGRSKYVTVKDLVNDKNTLPAVSKANIVRCTITSGAIDLNTLSIPDTTSDTPATNFRVSIDRSNPYTITPTPPSPANQGTQPATTNSGPPTFTSLSDLAKAIQDQVRSKSPTISGFKDFACEAVLAGDGSDKKKGNLKLTSGSYGRNSSLEIIPTDAMAEKLKLTGNPSNPSPFTLSGGGGSSVFADGEAYNLFIGDFLLRQGIYALETVDLFNLLCLPGVTDPKILNAANTYCQQRRAFLIADPPEGTDPNTMAMQAQDNTAFPFAEYAAIYYPWVQIADPANQGALTSFPPSGTMAGVFARTDSTRGVWKAPAGVEATLAGVLALEYKLNDAQNGVLNSSAVNCLRIFPVYGAVCWGARTRAGIDGSGSEYNYISVRRTALYIEESLYRGLKWAVFEPNDEPLWAQIRLNVGAFMNDLFRKGAFQGKTPREAYFVKCDSETTTQEDIDRGIVNVVVGFAPLKPAEFVVVTVQQIAGQLQV